MHGAMNEKGNKLNFRGKIGIDICNFEDYLKEKFKFYAQIMLMAAYHILFLQRELLV